MSPKGEGGIFPDILPDMGARSDQPHLDLLLTELLQSKLGQKPSYCPFHSFKTRSPEVYQKDPNMAEAEHFQERVA